MSTNLEDLILRDTRANQPAFGIPGRLYYVTDEHKLERDSGAAWENVEAVTGGGGDFDADYQQTDYHGGNINLGTSAGSWGDADSTNAKISFTPASDGKYRVTFTLIHYRACHGSPGQIDIWFRLTDGTTTSPAFESFSRQTSQDDNTIIITLSFVFDWTAVAQTIKLQRKVTGATGVDSNLIECSNTEGSALMMLVERIGA